MKTLFFILSILNVTYFMWQFKTGAFQTENTQPALPTWAIQEPILLVSEAPKPKPLETIEPAEITPAPLIAELPAPASCFEIGPITESTELQNGLNRIDKNTIKLIHKDKSSAERYIVFYPGSNNPKDHQAILQMLKAHGINDFFTRRNSPEEVQISLGVFSTEIRAKSMLKQMQAKGINAQIESDYKLKAQVYLQIKEAHQPFDQLNAIQKRYTQASTNTIECW